MAWERRRHLARLAAMEAEQFRLLMRIPQIAPINPIDTSIKCGCEVRLLSLASLEGVYSPEPKPTIILGSERPAGRRSYTCAHELGHHIFKHGMRIDNFNARKHTQDSTSEEFLAEVFAGFLLMSKSAVLRTLKDRGWSATSMHPKQVYQLANYFGVGYGTITSHLAFSLRTISRKHATELQKYQPKQIKLQYGANTKSELIFADFYWRDRSVDLEVGDILALPQEVTTETRGRLELIDKINQSLVYRAIKPGNARSLCDERNWAVNVRISRKNYEGLAQYRFLEEGEGE